MGNGLRAPAFEVVAEAQVAACVGRLVGIDGEGQKLRLVQLTAQEPDDRIGPLTRVEVSGQRTEELLSGLVVARSAPARWPRITA